MSFGSCKSEPDLDELCYVLLIYVNLKLDIRCQPQSFACRSASGLSSLVGSRSSIKRTCRMGEAKHVVLHSHADYTLEDDPMDPENHWLVEDFTLGPKARTSGSMLVDSGV